MCVRSEERDIANVTGKMSELNSAQKAKVGKLDGSVRQSLSLNSVKILPAPGNQDRDCDKKVEGTVSSG